MKRLTKFANAFYFITWILFLTCAYAFLTDKYYVTGKMFGQLLGAVALAALILIAGLTKIIFASSAWRTQTVLYENSHFKFKKIEFQMQDKDALGYNKRTVEVIYLTKFFMIATAAPADIAQRSEWIKVEMDVNELKLK